MVLCRSSVVQVVLLANVFWESQGYLRAERHLPVVSGTIKPGSSSTVALAWYSALDGRDDGVSLLRLMKG